MALWCEHPGHEHPWPDATYTFAKNRQWFNELLPYASLILKTLNLLLPIAVDSADRVFDLESAEIIRIHLDAMEQLLDELTAPHIMSAGEQPPLGQVTMAEGAGLRVFRSLLLELDPVKAWGGLRRRLTSAGDYMWICEHHYHLYDPGLPVLPDVGPAS